MWYLWFTLIVFLITVFVQAIYLVTPGPFVFVMGTIFVIGTFVAAGQLLGHLSSAATRGVSRGSQLFRRRLKRIELHEALEAVAAAFSADDESVVLVADGGILSLSILRGDWGLYMSYEIFDDIGYTCLSLSGGGYFSSDLMLEPTGRSLQESAFGRGDQAWSPGPAEELSPQIVAFLEEATQLYQSGDEALLLLLAAPDKRRKISQLLTSALFEVKYGAIDLQLHGYVHDASLLIERFRQMEALALLLADPPHIPTALMTLVEEEPDSILSLFALDLLLTRFITSRTQPLALAVAMNAQRPSYRFIAARLRIVPEPAMMERFFQEHKDTRHAHLCQYGLELLAQHHPDLAEPWLRDWLHGEGAPPRARSKVLFFCAAKTVRRLELGAYLPIIVEYFRVASVPEKEVDTKYVEEAIATIGALGDTTHEELLLQHHSSAPEWMKIAIAGALAKVGTGQSLHLLLQAQELLAKNYEDSYSYLLASAYEEAITELRARLATLEAGGLSLADDDNPGDAGALSLNDDDASVGAVSLVPAENEAPT